MNKRPVEPGIIIDIFNDALADLVSEVVDIDEERLMQKVSVPAAVVAVDPIDLTHNGVATATREWLAISYIDWVDEDGESDEVHIGTVEARSRIEEEADGFFAAYAIDQMRTLKPIGDWSGIETLDVFGVLAPTKVTEDTIETQTFDFPTPLKSTLRWDLLLQLAPHVGVVDKRYDYWMKQADVARQRLFGLAAQHIHSTVDDVPRKVHW
jgi:hypothetical protein